MKPTKTLIAASLFAIAASGTTLLTAEEKKLTEKQVPKAVVEAFHKAYPKATGIKFEKEEEAGKTLYEIEFSNETTKLEATYTAEGLLTHTEETIKPADLPATITDAIKKAHPKASIEEAETVMNPDGTITGYEVEIRDGKKKLELELDETGKITKTRND